MEYKNYDEKYANLLISKCIVNDGEKPLVIVYDGDQIEKFAKLCYLKAKENGFKKVELFDKKSEKISEYISKTPLNKIENNELLDRSLLVDYAKQNSNFLYLETYKESKKKNNPEKSAKVTKIIDDQLEVYYENTSNFKCPWCVACYPNKAWAKRVYPDLPLEEAYKKLYLNIMKMCQVDKDDPEKEWDNIHKRYYEISEKLNELRIQRLHYTNDLGTDLNIVLPDNHLWIGADDRDYFGNSIIVNMPGYEIFTSPVASETNGIVYASKPLYYNKVLESFGFEFKNGKVEKICAASIDDYEILNYILKRDEGSRYLGECAIVENDTPVNLTNTLYYELLYDENASCHLALGESFPDALKGGLEMSSEELIKNGLNSSNTHVDFMIGTPDLKIEADTKDGKRLIYTNGKFTL